MTRTALRPHHLRNEDKTLLVTEIAVFLDSGFTCVPEGIVVLRWCDRLRDWWFPCEQGRHYIHGQLDHDRDRFDGDGDYYVGIYLDE